MDLGPFMFQMGVVLLVAFMAAAIALRFRLSAIVGYMAVGILLGPHLHLALGSWRYDGVVTDLSFLATVSQVGLVLLLFFVGLNFPMSRLRRAGGASLIMAFLNLAFNMATGMALGFALGWPLVDTIFLAGVVSMSSSSVTAKSLMDLGRLGERDTDFLLGMVILESFMAMFLLTAVNGMVMQVGGTARDMGSVLLGMVVFVAFFVFLAVGVIPRVAALFRHLRSDELFIVSSLGMVLMAAALAEAFYIPSVIGAFFIGMAFADTKLHDRLADKMEGLRDTFVAFFFLSFGMGLDPALFPAALPIVLVAIPLILLNDYLLTGLVGYLLGFRGQAALDISSGMVGRNEEAVLYANVGTRAIQSNPSLGQMDGVRLLNPVAGLVCMVTSALAPALMGSSGAMARAFRRVTPRAWHLGGEVVRRTLGGLVLPPTIAVRRRHPFLQAALVAVLIHAFLLLLLPPPLRTYPVLGIPATVGAVAGALWSALGRSVAVVLPGGGGTVVSATRARSLTTGAIAGALGTGLVMAALMAYPWWFLPLAPLAYLGGLTLAMAHLDRGDGVRPRSWVAAGDGGVGR